MLHSQHRLVCDTQTEVMRCLNLHWKVKAWITDQSYMANVYTMKLSNLLQEAFACYGAAKQFHSVAVKFVHVINHIDSKLSVPK